MVYHLPLHRHAIGQVLSTAFRCLSCRADVVDELQCGDKRLLGDDCPSALKPAPPATVDDDGKKHRSIICHRSRSNQLASTDAKAAVSRRHGGLPRLNDAVPVCMASGCSPERTARTDMSVNKYTMKRNRAKGWIDPAQKDFSSLMGALRKKKYTHIENPSVQDTLKAVTSRTYRLARVPVHWPHPHSTASSCTFPNRLGRHSESAGGKWSHRPSR